VAEAVVDLVPLITELQVAEELILALDLELQPVQELLVKEITVAVAIVVILMEHKFLVAEAAVQQVQAVEHLQLLVEQAVQEQLHHILVHQQHILAEAAAEHIVQLQLYLLRAVQAVLVEVVEAVEADQFLLQELPVM
jgi:hypothetical protein